MTKSWNKRRSGHSLSPSNRSRSVSPHVLSTQKKDVQQSVLTAVRSGKNEIDIQTRKVGEVISSDRKVKLPVCLESEKADTVIKAPTEDEDEDEDKIKIILNKAAKPWHGMADPLDRHFPALVKIDPVLPDRRKLGDTGITPYHLNNALMDDGLTTDLSNVKHTLRSE